MKVDKVVEKLMETGMGQPEAMSLVNAKVLELTKKMKKDLTEDILNRLTLQDKVKKRRKE